MHTAPAVPSVEGVTSRWVRAAGTSLHVPEAGDPAGEVVVMLHGWPQHFYAWRHVVPLLPPGLRVLMPDLRGFGWSGAPRGPYGKEQHAHDLVAVLDALGIERVTLVGHDWGGWIGFLTALRWPDRVRSLLGVAILPPFPSTAAATAREPRRFAYQPLLATPVLSPLVLRHVRQAVPYALAKAAARPGGCEPDAVQSYADVLREPGRARASSRMYRTFLRSEVAAVRAGRYVGPLEVPARLLLGARDPVIRPAMVRGAQEFAPGLEVEVLPGVGHLVPEEAPAEVAAAVVRAHEAGSGG